mmetsp:Transcript_22933/g.54240  ORF Transcript_22933/g.54240 Transcript_22933/m.54240 type:complete len:267 (-) Transcript_22933:1025-1825(-)
MPPMRSFDPSSDAAGFAAVSFVRRLSGGASGFATGRLLLRSSAPSSGEAGFGLGFRWLSRLLDFADSAVGAMPRWIDAEAPRGTALLSVALSVAEMVPSVPASETSWVDDDAAFRCCDDVSLATIPRDAMLAIPVAAIAAFVVAESACSGPFENATDTGSIGAVAGIQTVRPGPFRMASVCRPTTAGTWGAAAASALGAFELLPSRASCACTSDGFLIGCRCRCCRVSSSSIDCSSSCAFRMFSLVLRGAAPPRRPRNSSSCSSCS